MNAGSFLKNFICFSIAFLLFAAGIVILFDPFYHYHAPLPGLKAVLTDKEYQCIGSLRHFDYDSVLAGSSVAENFNNRWFDDAFRVTLIKAIRASGSTADLHYYLQEAYQSREKRGSQIRRVFYNLDTAALFADPAPSFEAAGQPMYLYNRNPFDDVLYLWNKDVLLEKLPLMLADSFLKEYDEGESYNWAKWKTFGTDMVRKAYTPAEEMLPSRGADADSELLAANLSMLTELVGSHPETEFVFYFPPYSLVWWDEAYRTGELERDLKGKETAADKLLSYPNVRVYDFQEDETVILDPENYMDTLHFSPEITFQMFQAFSGERPADALGNPYEVTEERIRKNTERMRQLMERIEETELWKYYEKP